MYIYLGQDTVINTDKIVGIFDIDNTTISKHTRFFLAEAQKSGRIITVGAELPKSFIVCQEKNEVTVYLTQTSPSTLRKRAYSL